MCKKCEKPGGIFRKTLGNFSNFSIEKINHHITAWKTSYFLTHFYQTFSQPISPLQPLQFLNFSPLSTNLAMMTKLKKGII